MCSFKTCVSLRYVEWAVYLRQVEWLASLRHGSKMFGSCQAGGVRFLSLRQLVRSVSFRQVEWSWVRCLLMAGGVRCLFKASLICCLSYRQVKWDPSLRHGSEMSLSGRWSEVSLFRQLVWSVSFRQVEWSWVRCLLKAGGVNFFFRASWVNMS